MSFVFLSAQETLIPTQINVFKNGTYFIVKEGTVKPVDSKFSLYIPIQPLLGTYWINTAKDVKIAEVSYVTDSIKTMVTAKNIPEVAFANKGKKVKVGYMTDEKTYKDISGTLQEYFKSSGMLKIKTAEGKTQYLMINTVTDFTVEEVPADKMQVDSVTRLAKVKLAKSIESTPIKLIYMQKGMQWIPSYNVKLISDKELQLEMKALVENNMESIDNAELTLTVGNPQFFYGFTIDPIAKSTETNISTIYNATKGLGYGGNVMVQTNAYQSYSTDASSATGYDYDNYDYNDYGTYTTEGEKTNDLYMYKLGKVSLAKDSKTSFQIFSNNLPYKDVYQVDIYDVVNYSYNSYIGNDPEQKFDVYHSFKLTNTTDNPFTTAPVFVMDENLQPLAQDQMKYTPTKSDVSIQLSKASDVIVKNSEEESLKTDDTKKYGKDTYTKVKLKGSIIVENQQSKKITLSVSKNLTADVSEVSDDGTIKKTGKYYGLNPYSEISWEVSVGANDKKTITYNYEVWVRSK